MTISQKLIDVNTAKTNIKSAIEAKGVDTTGVPFTDYHTKIGEISGGGGEVINNLTWTRNSEWLTVTPPLATENKIVILARVIDLNGDMNKIGFQIGWTGVQPTVDWGDGTVENVSNNIDMWHEYDFNNPAIGGLTSEGYKQVIITIDAPSGSFTRTWFQRFLSGYTYFNDGILEIHYSAPTCGDINFGAIQSSHPYLEYLNVVSWNPTSYADKFSYLTNVYKIDAPFQTTSNYRNVVAPAMFNRCYNLYAAPAIDYSAINGSTSSMFTDCSNIRTFSNVDMSGMTSTLPTNMFQYCNSLVEAPMFNTTATNFSNLFADCFSLTSVPDYNTTNVDNIYNCFVNCTSLETLPNWDTSNVTNWSYAFSVCQSLREIPATWDFTGATNYMATFQRCYRLKDVNHLTFTTTPVDTTFMFQYCQSLVEITTPIYSNKTYYMLSYSKALRKIKNITASGGDGRYIFRFGQSIVEISDCDLSGLTSTTTMFAGLTSKISRFKSIGPAVTFDLSSQELSAPAIDEMFSLLPTVTGQTVNVSNNPGSATCDPSIATAKGWTVTS